MEENLGESDSSSQKLPSSEAALGFLVDFLDAWNEESGEGRDGGHE